MNSQCMFVSSRTQRVVSLSSCEAELHALVSTLSDGIYIRRFFFRPTPYGFRQVVQHVSKHVAYEIN